MPDPVGQMIASLNERLARLEAESTEKEERRNGPLARMPGG